MTLSADEIRAPDPIQYLDQVAATAPARDYKQQLLAALDLRAGHAVLDVGCGPGTDLAELADTVTESGTVVGVDHNPLMVERARRRLAGRPWVGVHVAAADALPLADASVDRARADRVLMHLADPVPALAELRRVVRPGGLLALAEPDWDTLVVDAPDIAASRAVTRHIATGLDRSGAMGRQLARLATHAGFAVPDVRATAVLLRDFRTADQVLGLRRNLHRTVEAGGLGEVAARRWLQDVSSGPFVAAFTLFTTIAAVP